MALVNDVEESAENRCAKKLYEKNMLPDVNPHFVKKILSVVYREMPNPTVGVLHREDTKRNWDHDKNVLRAARDQLVHLKDIFRPLPHWVWSEPLNSSSAL